MYSQLELSFQLKCVGHIKWLFFLCTLVDLCYFANLSLAWMPEVPHKTTLEEGHRLLNFLVSNTTHNTLYTITNKNNPTTGGDTLSRG